MDPLKICAKRLGLNGTQIHLIEVLMSFVPNNNIPLDSQGKHIVFASNKAIANRMGISGDSTINRCIRQLEAKGFLARQSSANKKRFRIVGRDGGTLRAYGIDIGPMVAAHSQLLQVAYEVRVEADETEELRLDCSEVLSKLRALADQMQTIPDDQTAQLARDIHLYQKLLRRVPSRELFTQALTDVQALLDLWITRCKHDKTAHKMSDSVAQNERHIDQPQEISFDDRQTVKEIDTRNQRDIETAFPMLTKLLEDCETEREVHRRLDHTAALLPNTEIAWRRAKAAHGTAKAALFLGYIIENIGKIRNPGGYLQTLTHQYSQKQLSIDALLL